MGNKSAESATPSAYEALVGMDYLTAKGRSRRAEKGDVLTDLPEKSIPWLLADGHIVETTKAEG